MSTVLAGGFFTTEPPGKCLSDVCLFVFPAGLGAGGGTCSIK